MKVTLCTLYLVLAYNLTTTLARPSVRGIKDTKQFDALIKKHKAETGLPVIVDFYSDGCGPCRQIAPVYKQVAKQYEGKAVSKTPNTTAANEPTD